MLSKWKSIALAITVTAVALAVIIVGLPERKDATATSHESHFCDVGFVSCAHAAEAYYTCPMHPTIVQEGPGTCPICGMDLVKKEAPAKSDEATHDQKAADSGQILYTCGMHPNVISEEPGTCPICGMDLTPMEKKTESAATAKGAVTVDPVVVQNMGVRVAPIKKGPIFRHIRTIGEVDVAEDEVSVVNLRFSGWIEKIWVDETGQEVKKGQWLFSIYSPELVSAQKEYLLAYNTNGKNSELTRSAAERLRLWDIPQSTLNAIIKNQNVERTLTISAPHTGYVLNKNVLEGARVNAGQDLYRIGNLNKIWVNAEVYEFDAPWIRIGQPAKMELSFQRGRQYDGKVGYIYPTLNPKSRTLKVRLEFENPGVELKPGMFATVRIEAQRKDDVLAIPTEAIIHSGVRNLVFISVGQGKYEPREIVTGLVGDNHQTEVLSGLTEGETVVTSGQFLLDSESQLQEAVQKLLEARLQAKSKMESSTSSSKGAEADGHKHTQEAATYWTCPMHPQIVQDGPGTCPICGMDLVEKKR